MRLLSLDLATRTGWAFGDTGEGQPSSGVNTLPSTGDDVGAFAKPFHLWLTGMINEREPDVVVYEAPILAGARTALATSRKLHGLCYHTELICTFRSIRCREVGSSTWKKAFCGNGAVRKPKTKAEAKINPYAVIVECERRGWRPQDDNEADALGLYSYALGALDPGNAHRLDPLFNSQQEAA